MLAFEIMKLRGISGVVYPFHVYVFDSELSSIQAIFAISSRICQVDGKERHRLFYVGQTDDLAECLSYFQKISWIKYSGANCLLVLAEDDEVKRTEIFEDIRSLYFTVATDERFENDGIQFQDIDSQEQLQSASQADRRFRWDFGP